MSEIAWQSQVGQDAWAYNVLGQKRDGVFLDIGCGHAKESSNTWTLETEFGWTGLRVDSGEFAGSARLSPFVRGDARLLNWTQLLKQHGLWPAVDYLSLDVDESSLEALRALPFADGWKFRCATTEHDFYRFGSVPRSAMRKLLHGFGFKLAKMNVSDKGLEFEDWWIL